MNAAPDFERLGDLLRGVQDVQELGSGAPHDGGSDTTGRSAPPAGSSVDRGGAHSAATDPRSPRPDVSRRLAAVWPDVVGPEAAANARPVQLRQGRLVVSASSSAWAQTLQLMSEAIVGRLNECLGPGSVERAVFRHAGWEEEARPSGAARPAGLPEGGPAGRPTTAVRPLSKEQEEALAEVEGLEVAPELRRRMAGAIKAAFVRAQQDSVR